MQRPDLRPGAAPASARPPAIEPLRLLALPIGGLLLGFGSPRCLTARGAPPSTSSRPMRCTAADPAARLALVCAQTIALERRRRVGRAGSSLCPGRRRLRLFVRPVAAAAAGRPAHPGRRRRGRRDRRGVQRAAHRRLLCLRDRPRRLHARGDRTGRRGLPVRGAARAALGIEAYVVALPGARAITTVDYLLYAGLGILCAIVGIAMVRAVTWIEALVAPLADPRALAAGARRAAADPAGDDHAAGAFRRPWRAPPRPRRRGRARLPRSSSA